jgi:hypothetical protein
MNWLMIIWGLHLVLPIYGLLVLLHYRTYKQNQRVLADALRAFDIIRAKQGR